MSLLRSVIHTNQTLQRNSQFISIQIRNYAFKSDLKIKWIHPGKIACYKPQKSGDLEPMPKIDKTQITPMFRNCKELEDANELVKKLFSLDFASHRETVGLYMQQTLKKVSRHPLDQGSIEAKIGKWTGIIRAWQETMEEHPRNRVLKVKLKELIDKRKKHLKYLRRWDYKKFEWLIEALNIEYKPAPAEYFRLTRRGALRKLTEKYCNDIQTERLQAYKLKLESEQPAFLEEKISTLEFIRKEQEDCGVPVTIAQEEIDIAKKQLEDLKAEQAKQVKVEE